jgi:hypothetical protein
MSQTLDFKDRRAEHAPILSKEEARQGETSGHVRTVLAVSLILSLIAFAVLYALNV